MRLVRSGDLYLLQALAQVSGGAEVERPVDAHHHQLRALRQLVRFGVSEDATGRRWIRRADPDIRLGGPADEQHQRQQHADVDRELETDQQGRDQRDHGDAHVGRAAFQKTVVFVEAQQTERAQYDDPGDSGDRHMLEQGRESEQRDGEG